MESFGSIGEESTKKFLVTEFLELYFRSIGEEGFCEGIFRSIWSCDEFSEEGFGEVVFRVVMKFKKYWDE